MSIEVCKVEHVSRNNFGERGDNEPAVLRASGTMPMSDPVFLNKSSGWGPPRTGKYSIPVIHPDSVANYRPNAHSHQISTRLEQYPSCKLHAGPTKHFARSKASPGHAYQGRPGGNAAILEPQMSKIRHVVGNFQKITS